MNPPARHLRFLLVEDHPGDAELVVRELRLAGLDFDWQRVMTEGDFLAGIATDPDLILSDFVLPQFSGPRALALLKASGREIPFIVISGTIGEETAVAVMKQGAADYLLKDRLARLGQAVLHALEAGRLQREQRALVAALQEAESRYRSIFENTIEGIYRSAADGRFLLANPALARILGYASPEELLQSGGAEAPHGYVDPGRRAEFARQLAAHGVVTDFESEVRRRDGQLIWVAENAQAVRDASGRLLYYEGTLENITKRKQAEADLKLFRALIERSNDGILVVDPATGRFVDCNDTSCRNLGYSRAELLALTPADVDTTIDQAGYEAAVTSLKQSLFATREGRHRRKDGTSYPVEVSLSLVTLDRDFVVALVRDISERHAAERRIREQAALLDHATDAIIVRELDGTVSYWNEGAERLFGRARSEALGRTLPELSLPELMLSPAAHASLLATGAWTGEIRQITKAGPEVNILSRQTLVRDAAGQPVSVFSINTDITERKQLEARFLHAQRLENLGSLASGIAHDLNNVLAPVLMATEILKKRLPEEADQKMISTMAASAKRGADIVRQVLTFARGVKGERVPVPIRHLLHEMVNIATETFPPAIKIEQEAPRDLWPVIGDATHLHQVLMNLCINARDAMPKGGRLSLKGANVTLDETFASMTPGAQAGPHVCIKISDTGTGIPAELFGKIFDPFFTTKEMGRGTGLGLSTVLGITRSHGGFLRVSSTPGLGSCFEVYLPAAPAAALPPARTETAAIPRGHGETILVVEDEPAIRIVVSHILKQFGYRPLLAIDGSDAMAVYMQQAAEIAAVLTDMVMPGMDGPTLVRTLRRINPQLPVIGMTGFGEHFNPDHLEDLKLPATLLKPFAAEALLSALHQVLPPPPPAVAPPPA